MDNEIIRRWDAYRILHDRRKGLPIFKNEEIQKIFLKCNRKLALRSFYALILCFTISSLVGFIASYFRVAENTPTVIVIVGGAVGWIILSRHWIKQKIMSNEFKQSDQLLLDAEKY